mgnify:CR=1 FL=1
MPAFCTSDEARELYWYTVHTGKVWKRIEDYFRHMEKKRAAGDYNPERARHGLMTLITLSAKSYSMEHSTGDDWVSMFRIPVRREVAEEIMTDTEAEWAAGNSWAA